MCTGVICEDSVFLGSSYRFTNVHKPRAFTERKEKYHQTLLKTGAGAVVTKDVLDYAMAYGHPNKMHVHICKCGIKLPDKDMPVRPACSTPYVF